MTERGPLTGIGGAPNPAGPSHSGDAPAPPPRPAPAGRSKGQAADLAAVRRTDALIEALAALRVPGNAAARPADESDPAVRLLRALITDVDDPAADPAPPAPPAPPGPGPRRRGPRTIVALGVAGAVLASTGVAAAGGGAVERSSAAPAPSAAGASGRDGGPAATDVDAATHDGPRSSVPPAPGSRTRKPSRDPERADIERIKRRLEDLFPHRRHHGRPDGPRMTTQSAPSVRPGGPSEDDPLRSLDALRREAQKRTGDYRDPRWDD
ncbi:hypothetical protein [Actinomadura monticuli]|uniref:Uncharacterized protein n=1 Tax=Actinomadura monticuli TaxID=3097367 RepID=A0ABV4QJE7_9ACTN